MTTLMTAVVGSLLAGCIHPAAVPVEGPRLEGRLALQVDRDPPESFVSEFELQGDARAGQLSLSGPLGATLAQAFWSPQEAVLVTPSGRSRHASLDALIQAALGEPVPMAALLDWLRGRPWPEVPHAALGEGRTGFEQLGWQVETDGLAQGRLQARRHQPPPALTLRVRLTTNEGDPR